MQAPGAEQLPAFDFMYDMAERAFFFRSMPTGNPSEGLGTDARGASETTIQGHNYMAPTVCSERAAHVPYTRTDTFGFATFWVRFDN